MKYMARRRQGCKEKGFPVRAGFRVRPGVTPAVSEKLRIHAAWNLDSPKKVGIGKKTGPGGKVSHTLGLTVKNIPPSLHLLSCPTFLGKSRFHALVLLNNEQGQFQRCAT